MLKAKKKASWAALEWVLFDKRVLALGCVIGWPMKLWARRETFGVWGGHVYAGGLGWVGCVQVAAMREMEVIWDGLLVEKFAAWMRVWWFVMVVMILVVVVTRGGGGWTPLETLDWRNGTTPCEVSTTNRIHHGPLTLTTHLQV